MSISAPKPMDLPAFLPFAERRERGRFEIWRSELVAMAPEPDALVNCGEKIPTGSMLAPAPVVVVEVVSPSSLKRDTGLKVDG